MKSVNSVPGALVVGLKNRCPISVRSRPLTAATNGPTMHFVSLGKSEKESTSRSFLGHDKSLLSNGSTTTCARSSIG
jgi:hypothetical protein